MRILIDAWENWDGSDGSHLYDCIEVNNWNEAEAAGLELAFSALDPVIPEIKAYALHEAKRGYDYEEIFHKTMLDCARYELWVPKE